MDFVKALALEDLEGCKAALAHHDSAESLNEQVERIKERVVSLHYYLALDFLYAALELADGTMPQDEFMRLAFKHFDYLWKEIEEDAGDTIGDWEEDGGEATPAVQRALHAKTSSTLRDVLADLRDRAKVRTPEDFLNALELVSLEFRDDPVLLKLRRLDLIMEVFPELNGGVK